MTMSAPVVALTPPTRVSVRVAWPELKLDLAVSTFHAPSFESAAKPACGSAAAKTNAARVEMTMRRAVAVEIFRVMGASIGWMCSVRVGHHCFRGFQCLTIDRLSAGRQPTVGGD